MNRSRSENGLAIAIALLLVIVILFVGAAGAGLLFFGARSSAVMHTLPQTTATAPPAVSPAPLGTFTLSGFDDTKHPETPALAAAADNSVILAYASQTSETERTLFVTRLTSGQTTTEAKPFRVLKAAKNDVQAHALPHLAAGGGKIFLGWREIVDGTPLYHVAISTDNGDTFGDPLRVHESDGARPSGIALAADDKGNVAASWLDHRAGVPQPFCAIMKADEAKFQTEIQVFASTNDEGVSACGTAVAIDPSGRVHVAFRNLTEDRYSVWLASRKLDSESVFGNAERVMELRSRTTEVTDADAPALAANTNYLVVCWNERSFKHDELYIAMRKLSEQTFSKPFILNTQGLTDGTKHLGHPQLVFRAKPSDNVMVSWEQVSSYATHVIVAECSMPLVTYPDPRDEKRIDLRGNETTQLSALAVLASGEVYAASVSTDSYNKSSRVRVDKHP